MGPWKAAVRAMEMPENPLYLCSVTRPYFLPTNEKRLGRLNIQVSICLWQLGRFVPFEYLLNYDGTFKTTAWEPSGRFHAGYKVLTCVYCQNLTVRNTSIW